MCSPERAFGGTDVNNVLQQPHMTWFRKMTTADIRNHIDTAFSHA
jgi:hypothetical protein